ncbi:MAG: AmmeMemoRadiSam system protein B [Candidatus Omnitrophota bacterium]|jgi:hypothetical protein
MATPDKIRRPAVAGQFYPSLRGELIKQISSFIDNKARKQDIIACVLPHAGYIYSGAVAVETLSRAEVKSRAILLGPNHTGYGARYSIMTEGSWQTPLGTARIDTYLAGRIAESSEYLEADEGAHEHEHSLEVELPLLQYFKEDIRIVPIILMPGELTALKDIGRGIAEAIIKDKAREEILIVASSDMTHYEPQEEAEKKDREAIKAILELDEEGLMESVARLNISMCGYAPVITMISAAKALGAKKAELIRYRTSADITKDKSSVVGYAGMIIY